MHGCEKKLSGKKTNKPAFYLNRTALTSGLNRQNATANEEIMDFSIFLMQRGLGGGFYRIDGRELIKQYKTVIETQTEEQIQMLVCLLFYQMFRFSF